VSANRLLDELSSICSATAEEAASAVPSATLRERMLDPGAAIADASGRVVACAALHHLGTFTTVARSVARDLSFELLPGEVVMLNDPYSGGSRVLDFHLLSPVDVGDPGGPWLVGARTTAADLGGDCFGGFNPGAREVWAEGARVTPLKAYRADGTPVTDALACVTLNSRTPRLLRAQLDAAAGALRDCGRLVCEAVATAEHPAAEASAALRSATAGEVAPAGDSSAAANVAVGAEVVRLTVRRAGERTALDFSESGAAGPGYLNGCRGTTVSAALSGALDGPEPGRINEGLLDPFEIVTRPGSVLDAPWPVATGRSTFELAQAVAGMVREALGHVAQAEPARDGLLGEDGRLNEELAHQLRADEAAA
jgi:N-methylhydantoinase B